MRSWENHIRGALTLLELRGEKQLEHDIGFQIFLVLRAQIVSFPLTYILHGRAADISYQIHRCLQRKVAVPDIIIELSSKALQHHPEVELPANILTLLAARLCSEKDRGVRDPIGSIYSLLL